MFYAYSVQSPNMATLVLQNENAGQVELSVPFDGLDNSNPASLENAISAKVIEWRWYFDASLSEIEWYFKRHC